MKQINKSNRKLIVSDCDEALWHCVISDNQQTQMKANLNFKSDSMAVYYRPYLFEFLMMFVNGDIKMELAIFTKGTRDYAKPIIDDILKKLQTEYGCTQEQVDQLFKIRLYREDLNADYKDLNLISQQSGVDIDDILLVDDLISNFEGQPQQGIQILKFNNIKGKDNELQKLGLYLKTFDLNRSLKSQNIFSLQNSPY